MRALSLFLMLFINGGLQAGEVRLMEVSHLDGIYRLEFDAVIAADFDKVYLLVTDHAHLEQLSDIIIESALIEASPDGKAQRRLVMRSCLLLYCVKAIMVEAFEELEEGQEIVIRTVIVPGQSNFKSGGTEWRLSRSGDSGSRIRFNSVEEPDFWLPPVI